jgi:hypothetical protein
MERRVSKLVVRAAAACLAAGLTVSCGKGISDGRGEVFTFVEVKPSGANVEVEDAVLRMYAGTVMAPALIALRRYETADPAGAVGPVFEIELPAVDTLASDPRLDIRTTSDVAAAPDVFTIGFLSPITADLKMWVPDSTNSYPDCPPLHVCGPVQGQSFTLPGSGKFPPTNVLKLAIVKRCGSRSDCGSQQSCQGGVCQQCLSSTDCNPP